MLLHTLYIEHGCNPTDDEVSKMGKLTKEMIDRHVREYAAFRGSLKDNWARFGKLAARINKEEGTTYTRRDLLAVVGLQTESNCNDSPAYMPGAPIVAPVVDPVVAVKKVAK